MNGEDGIMGRDKDIETGCHMGLDARIYALQNVGNNLLKSSYKWIIT